MIEITLQLDDNIVKHAVTTAWASEFLSPDSPYARGKDSSGWKEVMRQVMAHIEKMDLSEAINMAARAKLDGVIDEVVTIALRERAKKLAKDMVNNGTLLEDRHIDDIVAKGRMMQRYHAEIENTHK